MDEKLKKLDEQKENKTENSERDDELILDKFNKTMVEPLNHLRRNLIEGECLSCL